MANRRCSIWRYTKIDGQWKYVKPVYGRNNKIRPEDGTYYIRWRNASKIVWQRCSSAADAVYACERQEAFLTAKAHGILPQEQPVVGSPALQMNTTLPAWLEEYKLSHRAESHALMSQTLWEFLDTAIDSDPDPIVFLRSEDVAHEAFGAVPDPGDRGRILTGVPTKSALEAMLSHSGFPLIKYFDWHHAGIKQWDDLVDYHKGRRASLVAAREHS